MYIFHSKKFSEMIPVVTAVISLFINVFSVVTISWLPVLSSGALWHMHINLIDHITHYLGPNIKPHGG